MCELHITRSYLESIPDLGRAVSRAAAAYIITVADAAVTALTTVNLESLNLASIGIAPASVAAAQESLRAIADAPVTWMEHSDVPAAAQIWVAGTLVEMAQDKAKEAATAAAAPDEAVIVLPGEVENGAKDVILSHGALFMTCLNLRRVLVLLHETEGVQGHLTLQTTKAQQDALLALIQKLPANMWQIRHMYTLAEDKGAMKKMGLLVAHAVTAGGTNAALTLGSHGYYPLAVLAGATVGVNVNIGEAVAKPFDIKTRAELRMANRFYVIADEVRPGGGRAHP